LSAQVLGVYIHHQVHVDPTLKPWKSMRLNLGFDDGRAMTFRSTVLVPNPLLS
jgi:hypothetical protein